MTLTLTTPGTAPVTLAEAKKQTRTEFFNDDDTLLTGLLAAATEWVERHTGRSLAEHTWTLTLDSFPAAVRLPMPPTVEIVSIEYISEDGTTQTLAAGQYRLYGAGGFDPFVRPAWATCWPATADGEPDAVTIEYEAGAACPTPVKQAILLLVSHLYENREASTELALKDIPFGVDALLKDYRQQAF